MNRSKMRPTRLSYAATLVAVFLATSTLASAFLIQPYNYMLDDSAILDHSQAQQDAADRDEAAASADRDFLGLLSDSLNRLKAGRMMHEATGDDGSASSTHLSQEMADLISEKQQQQPGESVADIFLNAAQAAAEASQHQSEAVIQQQQSSANDNVDMAARGSILELDTSRQNVPSKSDMKESNQWYNPKEIIPALKISAMGKC